MTQTKEELQEEIGRAKAALKTIFDEIRVRLHLAGMDAKDIFRDVAEEADKIAHGATEVSKSALAELNKKLEELAASMKQPPKGEPPKSAD